MIYTEAKLDIDTQAIAKKVISLKKLWISRSNEFPFFTLGRCAYLDGKTEAYYKDSVWQNDILLKNFADLYITVNEWLSKTFKTSVCLAKDLSIPGFHIFPSSQKSIGISGKWHVDLPHKILDIETKTNGAYTVAIKIPSSGAGIDYIDDEACESFLPYTESNIILHSGSDFHRIASIKKYIPKEYRITLQGHIINRDDKLEVYW